MITSTKTNPTPSFHECQIQTSVKLSTPTAGSMTFVNDSIREVTAGALAGATTKTLVAPLDRLKLVVQLHGSLDSKLEHAYQGPWKALTRIVQEEGFFALWRGNMQTVSIQGGTSALNFLFMDWYKKIASQMVAEDQRFAKSFVSGALAGASAITVFYPIGLIRTQLALDVGKETRKFPNGMRDVIRYSVQTNGVSSLFQGYTVALASVSLYRMVYLGGYDYIKAELATQRQLHDVKELPWLQRFAIAQGVSMLASTIHYPLDSVRRRLMVQSDAKVQRYRNGYDCFVQIYQQEGVKGYFRGLGTNYVRSVGAALVLVSYDWFKALMTQHEK
eukprot:Nitzschia sp. Nitz4//scaffold117_size69655//23785//24865//NITZ4_006021-RA/size69655-augustus-gene-0.1-mRNA-1//1//CDS//3329533642//5916//frame0